MAQALTRQEQSTPKDRALPAEVSQNADVSSFSGKVSPAVSIANISQNDRLSDSEPAVRRWQDLIGSSLALEEQAENSDRWNMRQSVPFLLCLSTALWGLLFIAAL